VRFFRSTFRFKLDEPGEFRRPHKGTLFHMRRLTRELVKSAPRAARPQLARFARSLRTSRSLDAAGTKAIPMPVHANQSAARAYLRQWFAEGKIPKGFGNFFPKSSKSVKGSSKKSGGGEGGGEGGEGDPNSTEQVCWSCPRGRANRLICLSLSHPALPLCVVDRIPPLTSSSLASTSTDDSSRPHARRLDWAHVLPQPQLG
jgi:hypothetical protein